MITVPVIDDQKTKCLSFANKIIKTGNQFDRFNKSVSTQVIRTYVGKLAEYVFLYYLRSKGNLVEEADMFEIYQGSKNVDEFDFVLPTGESIDIKTASLPFHKRIMVPLSQFHLKKDYYVGIKLNFITQNNIIIPNNINSATIYGFITRDILEKQPTLNFGEGDCKSYPLEKMRDIDNLINKFL